MKFAIGCDHGGFLLKANVKKWLEAWGHEVEDFGTHSEQSVDFTEFAVNVCRSVAGGESDFGVLVCGTGIGMSMAANKIAGVRAAVCGDVFSAGMTRAHNDANVLCLGERVVGSGLAQKILEAFVQGKFEGGRHARRVGKINDLD
jgi:ribose 5-phosphate isomerase B